MEPADALVDAAMMVPVGEGRAAVEGGEGLWNGAKNWFKKPKKPKSLCPAVAAKADETIYVIGRQFDTAAAKDWAGHKILDIPNWTKSKNKEWIKKIIEERAKVYIGSPQTADNLYDKVKGRLRPFAEEIQQLKDAGYKEVGNYLLPPGT